MSTQSTLLPGGTWLLGDLTVARFGYGAMQLAGPGVMGPRPTTTTHSPSCATSSTSASPTSTPATPTGRASPTHLRENVAGAGLSLSEEDVAELDQIGR